MSRVKKSEILLDDYRLGRMVGYQFCYGQDRVMTRWGVVKEVISLGRHLLLTVQNWHTAELVVVSEEELRVVMPPAYSREAPAWLVQSAKGGIVQAQAKGEFCHEEV